MKNKREKMKKLVPYIATNFEIDALGRIVISDEKLLKTINGALGIEFGDVNIFDSDCPCNTGCTCNPLCPCNLDCFDCNIGICNIHCGKKNEGCPNGVCGRMY